jgi:hypothetical protein
MPNQRGHPIRPNDAFVLDRGDPNDTSMTESHDQIPGDHLDREDYSEQPYYTKTDPLWFFKKWRLPVISTTSINKIKSGLLEIHRDALSGHDEGREPAIHVNFVLRAYKVLAEELFRIGALTEDLMISQIPQMVFDASMTAYWFRYFPACLAKTTANQRQFGQFWIDPDQLDWIFLSYLRPEIEIWRLKLEDQSALSARIESTPQPRPADALGNAPNANIALSSRKKRGRPTEIPDERKQRALETHGGRARAQILYDTKYPTPQQVKNVSAIMKHYSAKRKPNQD